MRKSFRMSNFLDFIVIFIILAFSPGVIANQVGKPTDDMARDRIGEFFTATRTGTATTTVVVEKANASNLTIAKNTQTSSKKGGDIVDLDLTSPAFKDGDMIPKKYTADGEDVSPPLKWKKPPQGTKSLAIICDDPDAPVGTWDHWILFNIKPETTSLPENVPKQLTLPDGAKHGKNSWGRSSYGGPSPPAGKLHRYYFRLYALDIVLNLQPGVDKKTILKATEGHVLGGGVLMGRYGR